MPAGLDSISADGTDGSSAYPYSPPTIMMIARLGFLLTCANHLVGIAIQDSCRPPFMTLV